MSREPSSLDYSFLLATLAACVVFCIVHGDAITTGSVDLAHHYALAQALHVHGTVDPRLLSLTGVDMHMYPRAAHSLVAWLTPPGGSVLWTMTTLGWASAVLAYALLVRLQIMALGLSLATAAVLSVQTAVTVALLSSRRLYLMGAEIISDYFFTQAVANVVLFGIAVLAVRFAGADRLWVRMAIYVLSLFLFVELHFSAFIMLGVYAGLDVIWRAASLLGDGANRRHIAAETGLALGVLFVVLIIVLLSPSTENMRVIAANDGSIAAPYGSEHVIALVGAATLAAAAALAAGFRAVFARSAALRSFVFLNMAIGSATLVTWVLLAIGFGGSPYAVKKFQFLLHTGLLAMAGVAIALALERLRLAQWRIPVRPGLAAGLLAIGLTSLTLVKSEDRSDLIWIEAALKEWRNQNAQPVEPAAFFVSSRSNTINWLFSMGLLQTGSRLAYDQILVKGGGSGALAMISPVAVTVERSFAKVNEQCVQRRDGPVWVLQSACLDRTMIDAMPALLASGWHWVEPWGSWAAVAEPTIKVRCGAELGSRVKLGLRLFHRPGPVTIRAGDTTVWTGEVLNETYVVIDINPALCREGRVELRFQTPEPIRPMDVIDSNDARPLGLGLFAFERQ